MSGCLNRMKCQEMGFFIPLIKKKPSASISPPDPQQGAFCSPPTFRLFDFPPFPSLNFLYSVTHVVLWLGVVGPHSAARDHLIPHGLRQNGATYFFHWPWTGFKIRHNPENKVCSVLYYGLALRLLFWDFIQTCDGDSVIGQASFGTPIIMSFSNILSGIVKPYMILHNCIMYHVTKFVLSHKAKWNLICHCVVWFPWIYYFTFPVGLARIQGKRLVFWDFMRKLVNWGFVLQCFVLTLSSYFFQTSS